MKNQTTTITEDGRVFTDMYGKENPCISCGACCSKFRVSFYHGELSDMPMGWIPVELTAKVNSVYACMQGTEQGNGKCIALKGTIGQEVGCSIYDKRPSACKEFNVWDMNGVPNPKCQELRAKINLPLIKCQE